MPLAFPELLAYPERRPLWLPLSTLILRPEEAPIADPLLRPPCVPEGFETEPEALTRLVEDWFLVGGEGDRAGVELDLSAASAELNHRFFFGLEGVDDSATLLVSSLSLLSLTLSCTLGVAALLVPSSSDLGVISTSSASRYHFLRRV